MPWKPSDSYILEVGPEWAKEYDPHEPRDRIGRWTDKPGGGPPNANLPGSPSNPIDCGDDVNKAAKLLGAGKHVRLKQPDQVATLLDKLAEIANDAKAKGTKAPNYDLCKVSVKGTNLFCVDEDTEILTEYGWRRYDAVSAGDVVLTLNSDTGESEWQVATAISVFPEERRKMLLMDGKAHSSLTTLNHRWLAIDKRTAKMHWRTSEGLGWEDAVPVAARCANLPNESRWPDELVELVAWVSTEGAIKGGQARIYQSRRTNSEHCDRIEDALTALYGEAFEGDFRAVREARVATRTGGTRVATKGWRSTVNDATGVVTYFLSGPATRDVCEHLNDEKVVAPEFIMALTENQLRLFVERSLDGDGHRGEVAVFSQRNEGRTRAFEMACALLGVRTNTHARVDRRDRSHRQGRLQHCVSLLGSTQITPRVAAASAGSFEMRVVEHDGLVWCPTTPNGTWLARRRGSVYFTGNCAESKGVPRLKMPQLKGKPKPGSRGDKLPRDSSGEVDVTQDFVKMLKKQGIKIDLDEAEADHLRASQNELNGKKVAQISTHWDPSKAGGRMLVSRDNYIVDGHHRWAATIGQDARDGVLGDEKIKVQRIDMSITDLLFAANEFAKLMGIRAEGVKYAIEQIKRAGYTPSAQFKRIFPDFDCNCEGNP